MFGAIGGATAASCITFVSGAAIETEIDRTLGLKRRLAAVANTRGGIGKKSMINNDATPTIKVDAETYEVRADGVLLTCEPATILPMAQRYFLF
jgi:urease subunit alpha